VLTIPRMTRLTELYVRNGRQLRLAWLLVLVLLAACNNGNDGGGGGGTDGGGIY
jgi:hypothetical protein